MHRLVRGFEMTPEMVRREWTWQLRYGGYKQTDTYLRTWDGYCALGVLCDLAVKFGVTPGPEYMDGSYYYNGKRGEDDPDYRNYDQILPPEVAQWADIQPTGRLKDWRESVADNSDRIMPINVMDLNDTGKTFEEIADVIDEGRLEAFGTDG